LIDRLIGAVIEDILDRISWRTRIPIRDPPRLAVRR